MELLPADLSFSNSSSNVKTILSKRYSISFALAIFCLLFLTACNDDDDNSSPMPLEEGVGIVMRNTLQDPGESEVTYASLFGQSDSAYDENATLSNSSVEFSTALAQTGTPAGDINGLYEIDLFQNRIEFKVLPDATDAFWVNVFGLFPAGKVDRYYFTFSAPHNISGFSSSNSSLNVRVDSETVIVVELREGYDLQPGVAFSATLE